MSVPHQLLGQVLPKNIPAGRSERQIPCWDTKSILLQMMPNSLLHGLRRIKDDGMQQQLTAAVRWLP
jgi:hypothetical protein